MVTVLFTILNLSSKYGVSGQRVALTCFVVLVVAPTGIALIRSHSWAVVAASIEAFAGSIGTAVTTINAYRDPPGPPHTDGAAYTVMGGFVWTVGLVALGVVLMRPDTRRTMRTPAAGWYRDPWGVARLRWWDGTDWCPPTVS